MTAEEMLQYIEAAPMPCDGAPPFKRPEWEEPEQASDKVSAAYGWSARSISRGVLSILREDPDLLRASDPSNEFEPIRDAFERRWPKGFEWSGCSLWQWGWAISAARQALGADTR